ncbi:sulfotransferase 1B1-like [Ptychodera flava]|uniref:sulfotransferase 1B1-like n=1 Tax=Ptychodera flava TaxID=63121 RepID=UPI00396A8FE6
MAHTEGCSTVDGYVFSRLYDTKKLETRAVDGFKFRPEDVVVAGFPKSGNTWLVEVLKAMYTNWGLVEVSDTKCPIFLEEYTLYKRYLGKIRQQVVETTNLEDLPSPRLIQTHLPATVFPCHVLKDNGVKVIHMSRNPKDVVVSMYYFWNKFMHGQFSTGNWDQTVQAFVEDRLPLTPWIRHVGDWFQRGIEDNVLHVTYEEMTQDLPAIIRKVADFLRRPRTDEAIGKVVRTTSVGEMRNRLSKMIIADEEMIPKNENPFVRKGIVGDWKNHFTVAQSELFDAAIGVKTKNINRNIPYQ